MPAENHFDNGPDKTPNSYLMVARQVNTNLNPRVPVTETAMSDKKHFSRVQTSARALAMLLAFVIVFGVVVALTSSRMDITVSLGIGAGVGAAAAAFAFGVTA